MLVEDSKTATIFARGVLEELALTVNTVASTEEAIGTLSRDHHERAGARRSRLAGSMSGLLPKLIRHSGEMGSCSLPRARRAHPGNRPRLTC